MFQVREVPNENNLLSYIQLINDDISCKIFPNLGASIQEFIYKGLKIIDGISINKNGIDDYFNTYKSALLFPFPNRIKDGNYTFNNTDYQLDLNEPQLQNAIHGLVYNKHFKIVNKCTNSKEAKVSLTYKSDGLLVGYPFKFIFNIEYAIKMDGEITTSIEVINIDEKTLPFGIGWHPYFISQNLEKSSLSFNSDEHFICSERNIPQKIEKFELPSSFTIKNKIFDDGFSLLKSKVKFFDSKYELNLHFENKRKPFLQIYTPNHRKTIALEPMTCATDAFNNKNGLLQLSANENFKWEIILKVTPID